MSLGAQILDPDVAIGFSGCPRAQSRAATELLQTELSETHPHKNSTLTCDGFPLVYTFTTADSALRWTADLCPKGNARKRQASTRKAYQRLSQNKNAPPLGGSESYGAWLGGRIGENGSLCYKLYQDPNPQDVTQIGPLTAPAVAGFRPRLQMIGYGPAKQRCEYYYRFDDSSPYLLKRLLQVADLGDRFQDTVAIINSNARHPIKENLPGRAVGVSFAYDTPRSNPQLTLYFFARQFWGSDAAIRHAFLGLLQSAGRDPTPYAAASETLKSRHRSRTYHDMVALSITEQNHVWGLGLRPTSATSNQNLD